MQFRKTGVFCAAVTMVLMACTDSVSPTAVEDTERLALVERTLELKASVEAAGRLTPAHRQGLDSLQARIVAWQARTGRIDLSVSRARPASETPPVAAQVVGTPAGCEPCPNMTFRDGRICFLDGTACTPNDPVSRWCWYICVYVGPPRR